MFISLTRTSSDLSSWSRERWGVGALPSCTSFTSVFWGHTVYCGGCRVLWIIWISLFNTCLSSFFLKYLTARQDVLFFELRGSRPALIIGSCCFCCINRNSSLYWNIVRPLDPVLWKTATIRPYHFTYCWTLNKQKIWTFFFFFFTREAPGRRIGWILTLNLGNLMVSCRNCWWWGVYWEINFLEVPNFDSRPAPDIHTVAWTQMAWFVQLV